VTILILLLLSGTLGAQIDWPVYGADSGGSKYSGLKQINRENVSRLQVAWRLSTGEPLEPLPGRQKKPAFEATPIVVDGVMYFGTPYGKVFALDPVSGKVKWSYDAKIDRQGNYGDFANRGVSTWVDGRRRVGDPCRRRIYFASIDARLIALDAESGTACSDFGKQGEIDLTVGLRHGPEYKGEYQQTSPPAVINDLVVVGSAIADNHRSQAPSGEVRAFDARSGALRWTWHPLDSDAAGGGNAWSLLSVDARRNLVFVPTGSASPDYYGGLRPGDNRYANSVVALNAKTGKRVWHFQTVHHDIWDYDVASQPLLLTLKRQGREIPAVAVGSKTGHLFLLERRTGKPLFQVEERKVPESDVPGERTSPTQPVPLAPKPWVRQSLRAEDAWGVIEADRKWCYDQIASLRNEGIFTPPSLQGSLIIPGNVGGMNWGGMAWDRERELLIVPINNLPAVIRLIPAENFIAEQKTNRLGAEMTGQKGAPYGMSRMLLRSPSGLPCNPPPWGTLAAVAVATGEIRWQVPLGEFPKLPAEVAKSAGSISLGGPIVTAGGLTFIGASFDSFLKAYDVETGALLWRGALPTSARSVPMTYIAGGKQFVVISAGGHEGTITRIDNTVVAFSLP
jgi:quinoprotein glucose dehydrogenase